MSRPGRMIAYADRTWNPLTGCDGPVSSGCDRCWAWSMARRLAGRVGYAPWPDTFRPRLWPDRLEEPSRWRTSQIVATCFFGDIGCHPTYHLTALLDAVRRFGRHQFLLLTKRIDSPLFDMPWPGNVLVGVSVEDQGTYDERIVQRLRSRRYRKGQPPLRLDWLSIEPLLGPIVLDPVDTPPWIVIGQEHGPGARFGRMRWIMDIVSDCRRFDRRVFYKDNPMLAGDMPDAPPF